MQATLLRVEQRAPFTYSYYLQPERTYRYEAGQFCDVYLPADSDVSNRLHQFTLSSSPTEPHLMLTMRADLPVASPWKQAWHTLKPGQQVTISEPMGDFVLPKDTSLPLVFIAAGIGITPIRSITKWLTDRSQQRHAQLIHMVREPQQLLFEPLFEAYYAEAYIPIVTQPDGSWHGETGHLDAQRVRDLCGSPERAHYYIAGPEPFVESLTKGLIAQGIPRHAIITDAFLGYKNSLD